MLRQGVSVGESPTANQAGRRIFPWRSIYLKSGTREEVIEEAEEGRSRRLPAAMPILDVKSVFCVFGLGLKTQCILCICSHKARIHTPWGPLDPTSAPQANEGKFAVFREFSLILRSFDQHLTLGVGHLKTGN